MKKVGFIGLGNMGSKMSVNLVKAGFDVSGFDLNDTLVDNLSETGVKKAVSLRDVVIDKDLIITMLPDGNAVEKVLNENLNYIDKSCIVMDCSTIDVEKAKYLSKELYFKQLLFLDAPVSGGTVGAENGTLTFMVGGNESAFKKIQPLFDIMGSKSVYCGLSGSGQATKLCNNMLLAITMIGVSESFNMAKNLNLDLKTLFEVISTATGSCWAINNYCPIPNIGPKSPADNNFLPGFSAKLMSKDLKLAINAANISDSHVYFGKIAEELFSDMAEGINGDKDFSAIINEINKA